MRAAKDAVTLLGSFESPPPFKLWDNLVTERASRVASLLLDNHRIVFVNEIFRNCDASNLCDDGHWLVDGGITTGRRLWLTYQFDSLTDYDGRQHYTSIAGLISVVKRGQHGSELFFGFDWKAGGTLSRLMFDQPELAIIKKVLKTSNWHSAHTARTPDNKAIDPNRICYGP